MGNYIHQTVYIDGTEVGRHCSGEPEFFAEVLNEMGANEVDEHAHEWLRLFGAALTAEGEAALRAMVARLDAIDATSTEGR